MVRFFMDIQYNQSVQDADCRPGTKCRLKIDLPQVDLINFRVEYVTPLCPAGAG